VKKQILLVLATCALFLVACTDPSTLPIEPPTSAESRESEPVPTIDEAPPEEEQVAATVEEEIVAEQVPETKEKVMVEVEEGTIRALADKLGIDFGTRRRNWSSAMHDTGNLELIAQQFNLLRSGMHMASIQKTKGTWDFSTADLVVEFGESKKMKIRGQPLVWGQYYREGRTIGEDWTPTPTWVHTGKFTREDMIDILNEHIEKVVTNYRDRVGEWIVVNEPLFWHSGDGLKNNVWKAKLGEDYIELAFRKAREVAPNAVLILNEGGVDYRGQYLHDNKEEQFYNLVKDLVVKEVPIDAVGFHFHLAVPEFSYRTEPTIDKIISNFKRYGELGLDVYVTELDVRIEKPITQEKLERQAEVYTMVVEAVLKSEYCNSILVWGCTDKYSWNPDPNYSSPCMFDENFEPKLAYYAVIEVMEKYLSREE